MSGLLATNRERARPRRRPERLARVLARLLGRNRGAVGGLIVMTLLIAVALLANVIAPHSPVEQFRDNLLTPHGVAVPAASSRASCSAPTTSAATY